MSPRKTTILMLTTMMLMTPVSFAAASETEAEDEHGHLEVLNGQINVGGVFGETEIVVTEWTPLVAAQTSAQGNSLTIGTDSVLNGGTELEAYADEGSYQRNEGEIYSETDVVLEEEADDVSAKATGVGNNLNAGTSHDQGQLAAKQDNSGGVGAEVEVETSNDGGVYGTIETTSAAAGNNYIGAAAGSELSFDNALRQDNSGTIEARTNITTGFAGSGIVTSTAAVGNSATLVTGN